MVEFFKGQGELAETVAGQKVATGVLDNQLGIKLASHVDAVVVGRDGIVLGRDDGRLADLWRDFTIVRRRGHEVVQLGVGWQAPIEGADQEEADVVKTMPGHEAEGGHAAKAMGDQDQTVVSGYLLVDGRVPFRGLGCKRIRQEDPVELDSWCGGLF